MAKTRKKSSEEVLPKNIKLEPVELLRFENLALKLQNAEAALRALHGQRELLVAEVEKRIGAPLNRYHVAQDGTGTLLNLPGVPNGEEKKEEAAA